MTLIPPVVNGKGMFDMMIISTSPERVINCIQINSRHLSRLAGA